MSVSIFVAWAVLIFTWFNKPLFKDEEKYIQTNLVLTSGVVGAMICHVIDILFNMLTK
jgi:hypothetical protein